LSKAAAAVTAARRAATEAARREATRSIGALFSFCALLNRPAAAAAAVVGCRWRLAPFERRGDGSTSDKPERPAPSRGLMPTRLVKRNHREREASSAATCRRRLAATPRGPP